MTVNTFLDVGAHEGQTLEAVVGKFDRVVAFEPMPAQYAKLVVKYGGPGFRYDGQPDLHGYGLADFTGQREMYGTNDKLEASLYPDKLDVDEQTVTVCGFIEATAWFRANLRVSERVVMKLNCEGCEVAVMNNLLDSGEVEHIEEVLIDFDVRKVPSQRAAEGELLDRMRREGFNRYVLAEDVMHGQTHQARIINWLETRSLL